MEIFGLAAKQAVTVKADTASQAGRGDGIGFLGSITEAVKSGKIVMPGGAEMQQLDFQKAKFGIEKGLKVEETEEEQIRGFLTRIKKILSQRDPATP